MSDPFTAFVPSSKFGLMTGMAGSLRNTRPNTDGTGIHEREAKIPLSM